MAILVDKFHLSMEQIGKLTDRCLEEVYFHKRDKDGVIVIPQVAKEAPPERIETLETVLGDLAMLKATGLISDADFDKAQVDAKAKYG